MTNFAKLSGKEMELFLKKSKVCELRIICKDNCVNGFSKKNKDELVEFILINLKTIIVRNPYFLNIKMDDLTNEYLLKQNIQNLKNICKSFGLRGFSVCKKKDDYINFIKERIK